MVGLPLRRLLPYAAASLLVLAVGGWTLHASGGGSGGDGEPALVVSPAGTLSVTGSSPADGSVGSSVDDSGAGGGTTTTARPTVFVQVAGAVARPGVYEVDAGARVFEVLLQAGGVSPDGDEQALPLAAPVADGTRIFVPQRTDGAAGAVAGDGDSSSNAGGIVSTPALAPTPDGSSSPVSLSTATAAELDGLPGIGPTTAARIIAFRESNGPFTSVEELDDVPGIGPATVERLRDLVRP